MGADLYDVDQVPAITRSGIAVRRVVDAWNRLVELAPAADPDAELAAWHQLAGALDVLTDRWHEYRRLTDPDADAARLAARWDQVYGTAGVE